MLDKIYGHVLEKLCPILKYLKKNRTKNLQNKSLLYYMFDLPCAIVRNVFFVYILEPTYHFISQNKFMWQKSNLLFVSAHFFIILQQEAETLQIKV